MGKWFFQRREPHGLSHLIIGILIITIFVQTFSCQKIVSSSIEEDQSDSSGQVTTQTVSPPTFSLNGGTYSTSQTVTIQCATAGATIKFTTDGSDPKTSPTATEGNTVFVSMPMTIKAYAYKTGMEDSAVVTSSPFAITSGIVFVSTLGDDANQGTKDHPKRTIQAGIDLSDELFETGEVRVAAGLYETLSEITLKSGISVYGSYRSDFSARNLSSSVSVIEDKRTSGTCVTIYATDVDKPLIFDGFLVKGAHTDLESYCLAIGYSSNYITISNNTFQNGSSSLYNTFGILIGHSSPLIYNNVLYGGTASAVNTKIFMINDSNPRIYNNTFIADIGNYYRLLITLRLIEEEPGDFCHPILKNNLLVDLSSTTGGTAGLYYMLDSSMHDPYALTTNLFYMYPDATGDGAYFYYAPGNSANVNKNNYTTQTVTTTGNGSQLLTYEDPAWRNLVNVDPRFVNAAANDYHLQADSPARNAGTDLSSEIPAFDRDGNPRTPPWSIGAYERD